MKKKMSWMKQQGLMSLKYLREQNVVDVGNDTKVFLNWKVNY